MSLNDDLFLAQHLRAFIFLYYFLVMGAGVSDFLGVGVSGLILSCCPEPYFGPTCNSTFATKYAETYSAVTTAFDVGAVCLFAASVALAAFADRRRPGRRHVRAWLHQRSERAVYLTGILVGIPEPREME